MHTHVRRTLTLLADLILTLPNDPYPLYERVAVMAGKTPYAPQRCASRGARLSLPVGTLSSLSRERSLVGWC